MLPHHLALEKSVVLLETCCILERKKKSFSIFSLGNKKPLAPSRKLWKIKVFPKRCSWVNTNGKRSKVSSRQRWEINKVWVSLPSLLRAFSVPHVLSSLLIWDRLALTRVTRGCLLIWYLLSRAYARDVLSKDIQDISKSNRKVILGGGEEKLSWGQWNGNYQ